MCDVQHSLLLKPVNQFCGMLSCSFAGPSTQLQRVAQLSAG
jgi:hypothetical protein